MHQQKSKKVLIYIFLFLIVGTFNNKNLYQLNLTYIDKINVQGLGEKNNFELLKKLNFLKFKNLFFMNRSQIIKIIDSNTLVEEFYVFKNYPSTLNIVAPKILTENLV